MNSKLKMFYAALMLIVTGAAAGQSYDARNSGMGGTGVASSRYDAASTMNPALLTNFRPDDDLAIIVPAVGAVASDEDDVLDSLDSIADSLDQLSILVDSQNPGDIPDAIVLGTQIIAELEQIDGMPASAQLSGLINVSNPGKTLGWAIGLQTYVEGGALALYDENDQTVIAQAIIDQDSNVLDQLQSSGVALGAGVTELTLSLAHEFDIGGSRLSVGVTPKFQRVDTVFYQATVNDFTSDDADFDSDVYANDDSGVNVDVGVAWWATDNLSFGLMVRDLISEEYSTNVVNGTSAVYNVDARATVGVAWNTRLFTAALDIDLTKNKIFSDLVVGGIAATDIPSDALLFGETQFVSLGGEFNAFDWAQIRAGYRTDLEDVRDDLFTLGLALSPFDVFHLGLTGFIGENDTAGGLVELKFTF